MSGKPARNHKRSCALYADHSIILAKGITVKTPLRWAGSKKALLPVLRSFWQPTIKRYVEPFCGSACLFFDLEPKRALLGDINPELVTSYKMMKSCPAELGQALSQLRPNKKTYYFLRKLNPSTLSDLERAVRFLFLNRLCFNGIYRTNLQGSFNVPCGKSKTKITFLPNMFDEASALLKRAKLMNRDFETVLEGTEHGDFVYLDPPYAVSARRVFSEYHPDSFNAEDVQRLRSALRSLDRKNIPFLISYADSSEGRQIAKGWSSKRIKTKRNVAGFASDRRISYEILASNMDLSNQKNLSLR